MCALDYHQSAKLIITDTYRGPTPPPPRLSPAGDPIDSAAEMLSSLRTRAPQVSSEKLISTSSSRRPQSFPVNGPRSSLAGITIVALEWRAAQVIYLIMIQVVAALRDLVS